MKIAYLHLEGHKSLQGIHIGSDTPSFGEVVFTTGMTGYPESLTDPSFAGQILTFTYPMIGNYGVPEKIVSGAHFIANFESEKIWASGVVVSHASEEFIKWIGSENLTGIMGVDTRALTQKIREHGVIRGMITMNKQSPDWRQFPKIHQVSRVSLSEPVTYIPVKPNKKRITLIDCGVKHGIIRALLARGYTVTRVPWNTTIEEIGQVDAVICSNGPADPKDCPDTVKTIQKLIHRGIPFLGICLGHQLLALAIGADTYKMPYGHRGLNQPVLDILNNKSYVTSQNHGYAVNRKSIPKGYKEWFINLNDDTSEGIMSSNRRIRSIQFHPEGNPGPFDTQWVFDSL